MTTTIANLPPGTTCSDYWFDSSVANGTFPDNRDKATFSFNEKVFYKNTFEFLTNVKIG
jgi:hypothetical protein